MKTPEKDETELKLTEYLDGRLCATDAAEFEKRSGTDPALQAELRRYAALQEHLAALGQDAPDGVDYDDQRAQIMAAVERKMLLKGRTGRPRVLRPIFAAAGGIAAAILIAVSLTLLFRSNGEDPLRTEIVLTRLLPFATAADAEKPELRVEYRRMSPGELRPETDPQTHDPLPPGTVLVSIGRQDETFSDYPMFPGYLIATD